MLAPASRASAQAPSAASIAPAADSLTVPRIDTLLDLETVIRRALAVSPIAAQASAGVRLATSERRVANGAFLPALSANSSLLRSDITTALPGTSQSDNAYSAGLAASVDVFTGGRRGADRSRAAADLRSADATDVAQRFQVTLAAQRAFYEELRGTELTVVAHARVARAERGVRYANDRVRAGTATRSDGLRARLELTTARQQELAAFDTLQSAAYSLGRLVGSSGAVGAVPPASLEPRPLSLSDSDVTRLALASAPSVQAAAAAAEATRAATRAARAQYLPSIRVTGGYNAASQTTVIGAVRPGWQLLLGTSLPIFNGYLREDAVTRASAAAEVARITSLDVSRLVRSESSRLLGALRIAARNIALAEEAVTAATEDLRVQTERYRAGIATSLDQLTSELAVTQAELGLVAARYNYQVTRAAIEALVGRAL
ncbi:MAG: outer rane efflux protein [Gemmatimonadetes bacterium]|nr:outer rane efflux protein [Gemmatimonadota bacterium]